MKSLVYEYRKVCGNYGKQRIKYLQEMRSKFLFTEATFINILMKNTLLIFTLLSSFAYGQTLTENKVDEFTKRSVKKTSWENICQTRDLYASTRIARSDTFNYLSLRVMLKNEVFSVSERDKLMLMLDNDSIISLQTLSFQVTSAGGGAIGFMGSQSQGLQADYLLSYAQLVYLRNRKIKKIRLYTSDGYVDAEIKIKQAERIVNQINLVL